jgi:hypothetical protein
MDPADKKKDVQIEDARSGDSTHAVDHSELYNDRMTWQAFMAIVVSRYGTGYDDIVAHVSVGHCNAIHFIH